MIVGIHATGLGRYVPFRRRVGMQEGSSMRTPVAGFTHHVSLFELHPQPGPAVSPLMPAGFENAGLSPWKWSVLAAAISMWPPQLGLRLISNMRSEMA